MKKIWKFILVLATIASFSDFAFAQYDEKKNNKWDISIAYNSVEAQMDQKLFDTWVFPSANYYAYYGNKKDNSFSFSIIPKYRVDEDVFLRFEFGMTSINLHSYYNGDGDTLTQANGHIGGTATITKEDTLRQKIYRYSLGIQYNFFKIKFIDAYCGASLNYFKYSSLHWTDYINDGGWKLPSYMYTFYTATTPGGFAAGIGAFAGINVYLKKWISLGGEFSYSMLYYKLGGKQNGQFNRYQFDGTDYAEIHQQWSIYNNSSEGIQFSKVMPSFNISIQF